MDLGPDVLDFDEVEYDNFEFSVIICVKKVVVEELVVCLHLCGCWLLAAQF
jgi:hypothetical protein